MEFIMPIKSKELEKNYVSVVKHNNLIQGKYYLEASEQKLLYKIFEEIQRKNYTTREVKMKFQDFYIDYKSVIGKNITKNDFKNLLESLQDKKPYIIKGDEYIRTQWYSIHGKLDLSEVKLVLDEYVFEYIQSLEKNFTKIRLDSLYSFKSPHTIRIYELLKQWCNTRTSIPFPIDILKELLGIENNAGYSNFTNFNKYVLEKAVKELNEKSELNVTYNKVKQGRAVIGIEFIVTYKEGQNPSEKPQQIPEVPENNDQSFIIPEELSLDKKLYNIFKKQFSKYDFSDSEYSKVLFDAEQITFDKKDVTKIDNSVYKFFASVLTNKIKDIEILRKQKELNEVIQLNDEDWLDAKALNMSCLEYALFMKECDSPLDYIDYSKIEELSN